ncbi:PREDICTED: uncharacterized protein LOC104753522 [Camelina sativa]|uniref:Uncharacterized protein LOC104753522 n=1 Tax=Camelina sativa TaxID=90675 RepID=A0ABM0WPA1_CAMSA|nr:PREDICTED: uncharacterized protein LOC104753522 [Camelina sativa]
MRLRKAQNSSDANDLSTFSKWLLDIGDGKINEPNNGEVEIDIPKDLLITECDNPIQAIVKEIYGTSFATRNDAKFFCERTILSPRNDDVNKINQYMLSQIPGEEIQYLSSDSVETSDTSAYDDMIYTQEFLNSIQVSGLPNHVLTLKKGAPIMLLRNIDPKGGLCNGTRLIVTQMANHVIEARIVTVSSQRQYAFKFMTIWQSSGCHLIYKSEPVFRVMRFMRVGEYEGAPCLETTLDSSKIFIKPEFEGLEHHQAM